jgi:hypothetical protein
MKALGNRSLSSLFKRLLTLVWYLEFLLLLTPPLVFLDNDGISYSWPITLTSSKTNPIIAPVSDKISNFQLTGRLDTKKANAEQILSFDDSTLGRRWLQTLHNLIYIGLIMFVTWHLKKIFSGFSANQPFRDNNATRIKWIAFSILFLTCFDILETIFHRMYTSSTILLSGATLDPIQIKFDVRTFLLGLILLIVAEAFKKGYDYQVDSESIL